MDYRPPSDLAVDVAQELRARHEHCGSNHTAGGCHLADLSWVDVQEILDLAANLADGNPS